MNLSGQASAFDQIKELPDESVLCKKEGKIRMAFDFKKEYKELYKTGKEPVIVRVPQASYAAVRGSGDPNEEDGEYQKAISVLYAISYTIRMSYKGTHKIPGFYEYVVPPLEGFWWQEGIQGCDYTDKSAFHWISLIRLPDFVTKEEFAWAVTAASDTVTKRYRFSQ